MKAADAYILATPNVGVAAISARKDRHLGGGRDDRHFPGNGTRPPVTDRPSNDGFE
jgi:hypothetical protein